MCLCVSCVGPAALCVGRSAASCGLLSVPLSCDIHSLSSVCRSPPLLRCSRPQGALCASGIRFRVSYTQNDETLSRNSLRYVSEANLPMAIN